MKDTHREALVAAGLTRWAMGALASRIGQIYYEYYTRTSDARFLREACVWYDTIRKRQYFKPPAEAGGGGLEGGGAEGAALQQLRYYMRFALVCILLQELDKVRWQHFLCDECHTAAAPLAYK